MTRHGGCPHDVQRRTKTSVSDTRRILARLGLDPNAAAQCKLPVYEEARDLVVADVGRSGREHLLVPAAARAWAAMKAKAADDGISLVIVSAFRSVERQVELLRAKLEQGVSIDEIFSANAPPGHSEHHTGRAIDIGTLGCAPLAPEFDATPAFAWLTKHAAEFGFRLSYPEGNPFGICYEPWHWCFCES